MTIDGFYAVSFSALLRGGGLVVVENGKVRGGDNEYLYSGEVSGPSDRLRAVLKIKAFAPNAVSVFNTKGGEYILQLTGQVTGNDLVFSGSAPGSGQTITIRGRRLCGISLD